MFDSTPSEPQPSIDSNEITPSIVLSAFELVENVNAAMFFVNQEWRISYVNAEAENIWDMNRQELLGRVFWEAFPKVIGTPFEKAYRQAMEQREFVQLEEYFAPRQRWYEVHINPTRNGLAFYFRNITSSKQFEIRLKESEERFRFLSEATTEGIAVHDKGIILEANEAVARMFGFRLEEFIGKSLCDVLHPESVASFTQLVAEGKGGTNEGVALRKDGTTFTFEAEGRNIEYHGKKVRLSTIRNIQKRKETEETLRKTQAQLIMAQRMESIGLLAGGVAHDFNNLLTAISGYSELAALRLDPDDLVAHHIQEITKASARAAALTGQLLAFSRQQMLQPKIINLNERVADMAALLQRLIGEDIDLVSLPEPDLGLTQVDPTQLEQVILNLAVNARDAMPQGGKLTIETSNVELDATYRSQFHTEVKPGPYVMLAVSDTGTGMDAATRAKIFEPFFTTKEVGKGTGLGLATVYGIVKQSDGYIYVYSEPGLGSTFKVYLPRTVHQLQGKRVLPVVEIDTTTAEAPGPTQPLHGDETILVVEDDEAVRQLIRQSLQTYGYDVLEAADGEEALALLDDRQHPVHLILTDIIMPRLGGRELAERLSQKGSNVKIICTSGYTDRVVERHNILPRCKSFLQKPFTPSSLLMKVRDTLNAN